MNLRFPNLSLGALLMSYLDPHFDPDVFVSYSHGDPREGRAPLRDWTHALINRLKDELRSLETEFDNINIWIDPQIDPTAHLTDQLRARAGAAGVLMIVMTKRYLKSTWCHDEREWFSAQVSSREAGRVFVIRAQETNETDWPDFLRDARGHAIPGFGFYDPATGFPRGWPDLQAADGDFARELLRLQVALTRHLRRVRERAQSRAEAKARIMPLADALALPGGERRIYLHAPPESETLRADIGRALSGDGIVPLTVQTGSDPAAWQREAGERIATASRCEALALLRARDSERFIGDLLDIGIDERERIRARRGAPMPCAVLDRTGESLPIDVAPLGIEHFDVSETSWRGAFRDWLDAARNKQQAARL